MKSMSKSFDETWEQDKKTFINKPKLMPPFYHVPKKIMVLVPNLPGWPIWNDKSCGLQGLPGASSLSTASPEPRKLRKRPRRPLGLGVVGRGQLSSFFPEIAKCRKEHFPVVDAQKQRFSRKWEAALVFHQPSPTITYVSEILCVYIYIYIHTYQAPPINTLLVTSPWMQYPYRYPPFIHCVH